MGSGIERAYRSPKRCYPTQMRMIDSQLAFPDEMPPDEWQESVRIGTPQGMVTLRRAGDAVVFVTWGNADAGPSGRHGTMLVWAYAETGGGAVQTPQGSVDAECLSTPG